jgi:hypothetical protein
MLCKASYNGNKTFGSGFYVVGISSVLVNKKTWYHSVKFVHWFVDFFYTVFLKFKKKKNISGFLSGVGAGWDRLCTCYIPTGAYILAQATY